MLRRILVLSVLALSTGRVVAVEPGDLLPKDVEFNPEMTTPEQFFGFEVGTRHLDHHELVGYLKQLASESDRVTIEEYARSYGGRPLVMLFITSPANHSRIEAIRTTHLQLADPGASTEVDVETLPAVINMGYSIHGNEASGSNAAALVAYYLAAAEGKAHEQLLSDLVILLDPSLNPDGFARFAHWANHHRGAVPNADPNHREHREAWPGGRTNYYWFDLNRDWLSLAHPESRGRVEMFHRWKPNVVLDFHEMGTDATYFFQPGVPKRNHPLVPRRTIELTQKFADFHAAALDGVGSLYYTEEGFDDFFMGKGSTYPDLHGGVGILFEQASARGHLQESVNGPLSFPFAIRNHFLTSMSSLRATQAQRTQLLAHLRSFYQDAQSLARNATCAGYVVAAPGDPMRLHRFLEVLDQHQIRGYRLTRDFEAGGRTFPAKESFVIPADQPEFRFLQALFERRTEFEENIFYDVSTWTLPLAFNLHYAEFEAPLPEEQLGEVFSPDELPVSEPVFEPNDLAYVIDWRGYYAPKVLYALLAGDVKVKVATQPFHVQIDDREVSFGHGTLLVPVGIQPEKRELIVDVLKRAGEVGVSVHRTGTGLTPQGIDLGSNHFLVVPKPKVLLVTGDGVSGYEAGEVWHLLDRRYAVPVTLVDSHRLEGVDLADYTVLVLVSGNYGAVSESATERLKRFVADGGTLVAIGTSIRWLAEKEIAAVELRKTDASEETEDEPMPERRPYGEARRDTALKLVRGSIFRTRVDSTHPIGYGFLESETLPVFRNNTVFLEPSENPYSTPVVYDPQPLLSGYVSEENLQLLSGSASVVVAAKGKGRVIFMAEDPNFRAFWYGTNRTFANALFFGPVTRVP